MVVLSRNSSEKISTWYCKSSRATNTPFRNFSLRTVSRFVFCVITCLDPFSNDRLGISFSDIMGKKYSIIIIIMPFSVSSRSLDQALLHYVQGSNSLQADWLKTFKCGVIIGHHCPVMPAHYVTTQLRIQNKDRCFEPVEQ